MHGKKLFKTLSNVFHGHCNLMRCYIITLFVFKIGTWHNYMMVKREKGKKKKGRNLSVMAILALFRAFPRCPIFVIRLKTNIDRSSIGTPLYSF